MPKLHEEKVNVLKKPEWLKIRLHRTAEYADVQRIVRDHSLHTICSSGLCPNKAECWSRRTATFMILGEICTRNCRFCATLSGRPLPPDPSEPAKLAESVRLMGLRHVVVTSVTRDDLPDGGAAHWAECVRAIRAENPDVTIELLIPDLDAKPDLLDTVIASGPDIIGHNIETTERLTPLVRSRARYRTSLDVLRYLSEKGAVAKSGLMVGLGESDEEVLQTLRDLHAAGVKRTVMLTGDREEVAASVAKQLSLDEFHAQLLPGDKVERVEALLAAESGKGKLAFVGDGINDAPVLTRADVGIAMGAMGSDAAIEAADVVLMDDKPSNISRAIRVARKTMTIVWQNIIFALGIKLLILVLAALGIANMWLAVFGDVGVAIIAILNAMRAMGVKNL